jgi:hypothetical protein
MAAQPLGMSSSATDTPGKDADRHIGVICVTLTLRSIRHRDYR